VYYGLIRICMVLFAMDNRTFGPYCFFLSEADGRAAAAAPELLATAATLASPPVGSAGASSSVPTSSEYLHAYAPIRSIYLSACMSVCPSQSAASLEAVRTLLAVFLFYAASSLSILRKARGKEAETDQ
jgi:hypothetical protein